MNIINLLERIDEIASSDNQTDRNLAEYKAIVEIKDLLLDVRTRLAVVDSNDQYDHSNKDGLKARVAALEKTMAIHDATIDVLNNPELIDGLAKRITALEAKAPAAESPASEPKRGLYGKYRVLKADTGEPVSGDYFVLKLTDKHARYALQAYASSCERFDENLELAADLRELVWRWDGAS